MGKLVLISLLVATIVIPARAARDPNPVRGMKRAVGHTVAFVVCYTAALVFVYLKGI
jgi:hypothetical protein